MEGPWLYYYPDDVLLVAPVHIAVLMPYPAQINLVNLTSVSFIPNPNKSVPSLQTQMKFLDIQLW